MTLKFDKKNHIYKYDNKIVPSVTQVIEDLLPSYKVAVGYLKRGSAVHICAAFIAQGKQFKHDPKIDGQVQALYKFFEVMQPQPLLVEHRMYSGLHKFAGTIDLYCIINNKYYLIDYKGSLNQERTAIQLGGYAILLDNFKVKYGYGVQINDDGTFKMSEKIRLETYKNKFINLLNAYNIREKLGYH